MTTDGFAFLPEHDGTLTLEAAVYQAIGAASVCWEDMSTTGIFDDARARVIAEALLEKIRTTPPPVGDGLAGMLELQTVFVDAARRAGIDVEVTAMRDATCVITRTGIYAARVAREQAEIEADE